MIKTLILIFIFMFKSNASACGSSHGITRAKIVYKGTSLEANPIVVLAGHIYFDYGTPDQTSLFFDLTKNKWCSNDDAVGCLSEGSSGKTKMSGSGTEDFIRIENKKEVYSEIEISGNDLIIYPIDSQKKRVKNSSIKIIDKKRDGMGTVELRSSAGSKARVQGIPTRCAQKSNEVVLDFSKSDTQFGFADSKPVGAGSSAGSK